MHIAPSPREKLEWLCRYVSRPAFATERDWARRLKRVFGIGIKRCIHCSGTLDLIAKILSHLQRTAPQRYQPALPLGARVLPVP